MNKGENSSSSGSYLMVINAGSADWDPTPKELDKLAEAGIDALKSIVPNPNGRVAVMSLRHDVNISVHHLNGGMVLSKDVKLKQPLRKGKVKARLLVLPQERSPT